MDSQDYAAAIEPTLVGLDESAKRCICARIPTVHNFYIQHRFAFPQPELLPAARPIFIAIEEQMLLQHSQKPHPTNRGRAYWERKYLAPLAEELHMVAAAERHILHQCWKRHLFSHIPSNAPRRQKHRLEAPPLESLTDTLLSLLHTTADASQKAAQLVEERFCRDDQMAQAVIAAFDTRDDVAKTFTRGLFMEYDGIGLIGLLRHSGHPAEQELLLLQRKLRKYPMLQQDGIPHDIVGLMRSLIIALRHAFIAVNPDLWQAHILTDARGTRERQQLQKSLEPHQQALVAALGDHFTGSTLDAKELFARVLDGGIDEAIAWCCARTYHTNSHEIQRHQLVDLLHTLLVGIPEDIQFEISEYVSHLHDARAEVGIRFPLEQMLLTYPSREARKKIGRRFWFARAATAKRIQKRLKYRRKQFYQPQQFVYTAKSKRPSLTSDADRLVAAFARRALLTNRSARRLMSDLISFGPMRLIVPKSRRLQSIDERQLELMKLLKWGHPQHPEIIEKIITTVNAYQAVLGWPSLAPQVIIPLLQDISKADQWHGGRGKAMYGISQHPVRDDTPRILAAWLIVPLLIHLPCSDNDGFFIGDERHLLLVIDVESELITGGWICESAPSAREVNLAIYHALWHPSIPTWPLRGIPETIIVPQELATDTTALARAAELLITQIDVRPDTKLPEMLSLNDIKLDIQMQGMQELRPDMSGSPLPDAEALRLLFEWLREKHFPGHRSNDDAEAIRTYGLTLPGHTTPAAGWLLPQAGTATCTGDGVVFQGKRYTYHNFTGKVGQQFICRVFPYFYPSTAEGQGQVNDGIFIEVEQNGQSTLEYLQRHL